MTRATKSDIALCFLWVTRTRHQPCSRERPNFVVLPCWPSWGWMPDLACRRQCTLVAGQLSTFSQVSGLSCGTVDFETPGGKFISRWVGTGIVLTSYQTSVFVLFGKTFWKCTKEQIRLATREESMGAELLISDGRFRDLLQKANRPGLFGLKHLDISGEGCPPGDDPAEETSSDAEPSAVAEDPALSAAPTLRALGFPTSLP
jgi:hypothetical protein